MTLKKQIKLYAKTNKISIKKATNIVMQQLEQKRPSNIELRDIELQIRKIMFRKVVRGVITMIILICMNL